MINAFYIIPTVINAQLILLIPKLFEHKKQTMSGNNYIISTFSVLMTHHDYLMDPQLLH